MIDFFKSRYGWPTLLSLCLALVLNGTLTAQQYNFSRYMVEDGLAQSEVMDICQDRYGYFWLATFGGGVSKFDGVRFKNYSTDQGLLNQQVCSVLEDREGNIWLGHTGAGISKYDGTKFTHIGSEEGLDITRKLNLMEDSQGNIWIAAQHDGLYRYDGKEISFLGKEYGLDSSGAYFPIERPDGSIWFGTPNGLASFDGKHGTQYSHLPNAPTLNIQALADGPDGKLWLGGREGLFTFDGSAFSQFQLPPEVKVIEHLFFDSRNRLWISSRNGLLMLENGELLHFQNQEGLWDGWIYKVMEDRENNIWIVTNGDGISCYGRELFVHFGSAEGLEPASIYSILPMGGDTLLLGTKDGLLRFENDVFTRIPQVDQTNHGWILSLEKDSQGKVWMAAMNHILTLDQQKVNIPSFDPQIGKRVRVGVNRDSKGRMWVSTTGGLFLIDGDSITDMQSIDERLGDFIMKVHEDRKGDLWVLTNSNGLLKYDGETILEYGLRAGLPHLKTTDIIEDRNGNLWIGTYEGLARYRDGSFCYLSHREGLSNDLIYSLTQDKMGNIWAGTARGLSRISLDEWSDPLLIQTFGKAEGFRGLECQLGGAAAGSDGKLWFAHVDGLSMLDPLISTQNPSLPLVELNQVQLFLEDTDWLQYTDSLSAWDHLPIDLELPYKQNHLRFNYSGLTTNFPEKVTFRYRLNGLDEHWSPPSRETHAVYPSIPPGDYEFQVMAANSDGRWNPEPASFTFSITPPFWKTQWFYFLCAALVVMAMISVIRYRTHALSRSREELRILVEARTVELKGEKEKVEVLNRNLESLVENRTEQLAEANHELKLNNEKLISSANRLLSVNNDLDSLLYRASHDLKQPISSVKGLLSLMEMDTPTGQEMYRYIDMLNNSMGKLDHVVQDLENVSLITHHSLDIRKIDLDEMIQEVVSTPKRIEKHPEFEWQISLLPPDLSIRSDLYLLKYILNQLVDNAFQFAKKDGTASWCKIQATKDENGIRISFSDNGIGISEKDLAKVFHMFFRASKDSSGSGMGLYLVKAAVKKLEGSISVSSVLGEGTEFVISLPDAQV